MAIFPINVPFTPFPANFPIVVSQKVGFDDAPLMSVLVDNYTPYWIYLKDADSYIPPYWTGAVRPLTHTSQYAYAVVQDPFGTPPVQDLVNPAYFVHFVWSNEEQAPQSGAAIDGAVNTPVPGPVVTVGGTTPVIVPIIALSSNIVTNVAPGITTPMPFNITALNQGGTYLLVDPGGLGIQVLKPGTYLVMITCSVSATAADVGKTVGFATLPSQAGTGRDTIGIPAWSVPGGQFSMQVSGPYIAAAGDLIQAAVQNDLASVNNISAFDLSLFVSLIG